MSLHPLVSVVIATRNKEAALARTLQSIRRQIVPFHYEIVVIDDGSSDLTRRVCGEYAVDHYEFLPTTTYRNPAVARNQGYKAAKGEIIVAQSDEVLHYTPTVIAGLAEALHPGRMVFASVYNFDVAAERVLEPYVTPKRRRHLFFLGALYRSDVYAIGGNDEEFTKPAYEDDWFADCLVNGRGLKSDFLGSGVRGYHQHHDRFGAAEVYEESRLLYERKRSDATKSGVWQASGGPWEYR